MSRRRPLLAVVVAVVLATSLVACGGGSPGTPILANPVPAAPSLVATDAAARWPSPIHSPWSCHATTARTTA